VDNGGSSLGTTRPLSTALFPDVATAITESIHRVDSITPLIPNQQVGDPRPRGNDLVGAFGAGSFGYRVEQFQECVGRPECLIHLRHDDALRHVSSSPRQRRRGAGVLLIAGSGPTDRNGNSSLEAGPVNTLKTLADWLSQDGVASLRYDKLGSGKTGLGPYTLDPRRSACRSTSKRRAVRWSSSQGKDVNDHELGVFGHSEGGLFALLLATGHAGSTPPIHALGLFEPLSQRYLDLITPRSMRH